MLNTLKPFVIIQLSGKEFILEISSRTNFLFIHFAGIPANIE